jgi:hypothetical protein
MVMNPGAFMGNEKKTLHELLSPETNLSSQNTSSELEMRGQRRL